MIVASDYVVKGMLYQGVIGKMGNWDQSPMTLEEALEEAESYRNSGDFSEVYIELVGDIPTHTWHLIAGKWYGGSLV
jgi:hypothetical protein